MMQLEISYPQELYVWTDDVYISVNVENLIMSLLNPKLKPFCRDLTTIGRIEKIKEVTQMNLKNKLKKDTFGKTLRATDVSKPLTKTIDAVSEVSTQYGDRLKLNFTDGTSCFLSNTNLKQLGEEFGFESDKWNGHRVKLSQETIIIAGAKKKTLDIVAA